MSSLTNHLSLLLMLLASKEELLRRETSEADTLVVDRKHSFIKYSKPNFKAS